MNDQRQQETLTVPLALAAEAFGSGGAKRCTVASCSADAKRHGGGMGDDSFDRYAIMLSVGIIPGSSWSSGPGRCSRQDQAVVGTRLTSWRSMVQHAPTCFNMALSFHHSDILSKARWSMLQHVGACINMALSFCHVQQACNMQLRMQQACNMLRKASDRMSVYRSNLSGGGRSAGGVA